MYAVWTIYVAFLLGLKTFLIKFYVYQMINF